MNIKKKVLEALTPSEGVVLKEAMEQLGRQTLTGEQRWRLTQIQNVLGERVDQQKQDEP